MSWTRRRAAGWGCSWASWASLSAGAGAPALATATEVAPSLAKLGRQATPTVRRLRPTISALRDLSIAAGPLTRTLDESMADLLGVAQGWALAVQQRDGVSHLFRVS